MFSNTDECQVHIVNACCHIKPPTDTGRKNTVTSPIKHFCNCKHFKLACQSFDSGIPKNKKVHIGIESADVNVKSKNSTALKQRFIKTG